MSEAVKEREEGEVIDQWTAGDGALWRLAITKFGPAGHRPTYQRGIDGTQQPSWVSLHYVPDEIADRIEALKASRADYSTRIDAIQSALDKARATIARQSALATQLRAEAEGAKKELREAREACRNWEEYALAIETGDKEVVGFLWEYADAFREAALAMGALSVDQAAAVDRLAAKRAEGDVHAFPILGPCLCGKPWPHAHTAEQVEDWRRMGSAVGVDRSEPVILGADLATGPDKSVTYSTRDGSTFTQVPVPPASIRVTFRTPTGNEIEYRGADEPDLFRHLAWKGFKVVRVDSRQMTAPPPDGTVREKGEAELLGERLRKRDRREEETAAVDPYPGSEWELAGIRDVLGAAFPSGEQPTDAEVVAALKREVEKGRRAEVYAKNLDRERDVLRAVLAEARKGRDQLADRLTAAEKQAAHATECGRTAYAVCVDLTKEADMLRVALAKAETSKAAWEERVRAARADGFREARAAAGVAAGDALLDAARHLEASNPTGPGAPVNRYCATYLRERAKLYT